MTLRTNIEALAVRIGTEFKSIRTLISGTATGNISGLATTDKTSLVAAINEVQASAAAIDLTDLIDDAAASTTTTYSGTKISADISAAVAAVVASSPAALDTLNELAAALGNDANFATTTSTALGNRLRFDAAQTLSAGQQDQATTNLGMGNLSDINLVLTFEAALL